MLTQLGQKKSFMSSLAVKGFRPGQVDDVTPLLAAALPGKGDAGFQPFCLASLEGLGSEDHPFS